mgnify:CR=1 FL=1
MFLNKRNTTFIVLLLLSFKIFCNDKNPKILSFNNIFVLLNLSITIGSPLIIKEEEIMAIVTSGLIFFIASSIKYLWPLWYGFNSKINPNTFSLI